jgi:hypothetical protein
VNGIGHVRQVGDVALCIHVNRKRPWRVKAAMRLLRTLFSLLALTLLAGWAGFAWAQSVTLNLGDLEGPEWQARQVRIELNFGGASRIEITELKALGHSYARLALTCQRLDMSGGVTRCDGGLLEAPEKMPIAFVYAPAKRSLSLTLDPEPGEHWEIDLNGPDTTARLENASLLRLAPWLPGDLLPNAGRVTGAAHFSPLLAHADLQFSNAGFSDPTGLHAGEKLAGKMSVDAKRARDQDSWTWQSSASWDDGAVFWDPLYLSNTGHTISGEGEYSGTRLIARSFTANWPHLGKVSGDFNLNLATKRFERINVVGQGLQLAALRELIPQDWLEQHDLADLALAGSVDLEWRQIGSEIERLALKVAGAGVDAPTRQMHLTGLDLDLDYDAARPGTVTLAIAELRLRKLAAGPIKSAGEFRDGSLLIPSFVVPMAGGSMHLEDIAVYSLDGELSAELRGGFTPLSMEKLTTDLDLLSMGGTISASIPKMTYAGSKLTMGGALTFKIFDGNAVVDDIRLENPFGKTPRLTADLHLHGMDLEEATGAVKFGSISGKMDIDIDELVLENWQPLSFDAKVLTSPGDFKKRISQRAVQNISSIGGAGAGAAIEASFLHVVQSFGYQKIGLSCKLAKGVCELGGAENAAQGFVIIKGGGIPSVSVVGYNRRVGWQELLGRIRAVIAGNSKMVIK